MTVKLGWSMGDETDFMESRSKRWPKADLFNLGGVRLGRAGDSRPFGAVGRERLSLGCRRDGCCEGAR